MAPVFAYWDLRALAEPIRYLLHYKEIDFEDKRYPNRETWLNDKLSMNLDFPNLPYYIDGDVRLTQSLAILRYLARKYNIAGSNEDEKIRIELAEQQLIDLRTNFYFTCSNSEFENIKGDFIKSLPPQFKAWSVFLGERKFLAGDKITYVDFLAYDIFDFYELLTPTVLQEFPNLKQYMERMETLPQLQSYFKSSVYKRWPIFGTRAYFGGKGEEPKKVYKYQV